MDEYESLSHTKWECKYHVRAGLLAPRNPDEVGLRDSRAGDHYALNRADDSGNHNTDRRADPAISAGQPHERVGNEMKTGQLIWEREVPRNTGLAFDLKRGQLLRITAQTIIDFVCFNRANLRERFDQARTKANQRKVFISSGDMLVSKFNNTLMTIVEDTFEGHHDLQEGMCSRKRYELARDRGLWEITYGRPVSEMPTHGCTENLGSALEPYGIALEDVPSPLNLFQHMLIHPDGLLEHSTIRPKPPGAQTSLRAEMDLLAALSTCPDPIVGGTTGASVAVFEG